VEACRRQVVVPQEPHATTAVLAGETEQARTFVPQASEDVVGHHALGLTHRKPDATLLSLDRLVGLAGGAAARERSGGVTL